MRESNPPPRLEWPVSSPIDQRADIRSECAGQELNLQCPEAGGLQPPGRAKCPADAFDPDPDARAGVDTSPRQGPGIGRQPAEGEGVEPSRLIARPSSSRVPSPFGLPFRPCSTGGRNRTCELLFNREAHEPAHATPVTKPDLSRGGRIRTGVLLVPNQADCQAFPRPESSRLPSAQRESNPHFRHGKAAGCRYIMSTFADAELSKTESTGWDSNPRRRITGAESSPLDDRCRYGSNPDSKSAREESNLRLAVIGRLFSR